LFHQLSPSCNMFPRIASTPRSFTERAPVSSDHRMSHTILW
jgi:hypothetical protein